MMLLEHYDREEYADVFFVIWPRWENEIQGLSYSYFGRVKLLNIKELKKKYRRVIFYDLEHTCFIRMPWTRADWLVDVDEIWTPWLENSFLSYRLGLAALHKLHFVPLRACSYLMNQHIDTKQNPKFDWCFFGTPFYYRKQVARALRRADLSGICCSKRNQFNAKNLLANTRVTLNLPQFASPRNTQNVVRIFELLCLGKTVVSEQTSFNYFQGLITEVTEPLYNMAEAIINTEIKDNSKIYFDITYSDEAYNKYRNQCLNQYKIYKENDSKRT